jgi:dTDP-4-amino-4,6-dideoxygalactose transaminase
MIPVTKSYLPCKNKYKEYVDSIYESEWLTNNGSLLQDLERRLKEYLGVKHLILVANGSMALQLAYKALDLKGEVITTPFSYVATTSTLAWEGLKPVFADINPESFNIDPSRIEECITPETSAIVPVHVFGNPCDVEQIQDLANKYNLKVIYDAAHAFGTEYKGQSVLNYGDISTLSFHATKLFHTIEGGAVITNDDELAKKVRAMMNFGIASPTEISLLGTNAKLNEFEAAMGLCVLDEIDTIKAGRKNVWQKYKYQLKNASIIFQKWNKHSDNNHAYAPVLFDSEEELLSVEARLKEKNIHPRRYFYPSLDTLKYLRASKVCNVSREVASRILCLPMYPTLTCADQNKVIKEVQE